MESKNNEAKKVSETSQNRNIKKSIEDGFYIVTDKLSECECGSIIQIVNGKVENKTNSRKSFNTNNIERNKVDKIEENESNYLSKYKINERMEKHKNKIFNKIKELKIGDECYCKKDSEKIYIVDQINIDRNGIKFLLQSKEVINRREINAGAFDIEIIQNSDLEEFYIVTDAQHPHKMGTIFRIENGITKTFPDNVVINNQPINCEKFRKINIVEANFLKMFTNNKRIKKLSKEKFRKINELDVGDKCFVNRKEFIVDRKYLLSDQLKFDLTSKKSSTDVLAAVDASEIHFNKKIKTVIENVKSNLPSINNNLITRQNSTGSGASNDSKETIKSQKNSTDSGAFNDSKNKSKYKKDNIYESVSYESTQFIVINPRSSFVIDKDGGNHNISKRYLVIGIGNEQIFAKLLWKGMIDHQICIGCEMLSNVDNGTDGKFNGKRLFDCKSKKGVLIPLNENINTCEKENCVKHSELNGNEIIEDKNICCLETVESSFMNKKINDKIPLDIKQINSGICKWIGLINGEECVAITTDKNYSGRFYKEDGLISNLKEFGNQLQKTLIVETKYIPSIINCELINFNVINPYSFGNIIATNPTNHNKFINIKNKQKLELVKLLWKGKIDETICLGCEIFSDWEYGTSGSFKGKRLFECPDKRGVLIEMCNDIETCESEDHAIHSKIDENDVIKKNEICCFEILDKLTPKENLMDKYLIWTRNKKLKGICKWMGLINGKECVGISFKDHLTFSSFKILNELPSLVFLSNRGVEIEKLHFIHDKIVDLDKITSVKGEKFHTGNKIAVDCPINLKASDNNTKIFAGVVKWIGMINHEKCVGLDMEDEFEYGMDGTIDENNEFECRKKHGLLTLLSNVELYNDANTPHILENGIINPNKILTYEKGSNKDFFKEKINLKESVIANLNKGNIKLRGTLRCCGFMNKLPVGVIELREDHENGTDGRFWRYQLFECPNKRAIAVQPKNILKYDPVKFIDDIFVDNKYYFHQIHQVISKNLYKTGKLVEVASTPKLYGEIDCFFIYYDEQLLRIKLDTAQVKNFEQFNNIVHGDPDPYYSKIIVKENAVKEFKQQLLRDDKLSTINQNCIKYKALNPSGKFEKNDFVKFNNDRDNKYLIVDACFIINGSPCLSVTESILGDTTHYLIENDVCKVDCSELKLRYHEEVFIDPASISSLKGFIFNDFSAGNIVNLKNEFSLKIEGVIMFTGIANEITVCVIKPGMSSLQSFDETIVRKYKINGQNKFHSLWNGFDKPLFIVPSKILERQKICEIRNGISVKNPKLIQNIRGRKIEEKIVGFKCNGKKHFAKLKWAGLVDGDQCYGCEIDFDTEFGINGKFQDQILFECIDKHGILILASTITDCCKIEGHREIMEYQSKVINENSICCIKFDESIGKKVQIKINDQIKRKELNEYPFCKWMGYVNKIKCIGVEHKYDFNKGTNGTFCGVKLFECSDKYGALYKLSEFTSKMCVLKHIPQIDLHIMDPFDIKTIENGKETEKSMIYKCKEQTHLLNIKWRGCVNGDLCIGCELTSCVEYGTDGTFAGRNLFNCAERSGVLIPVSILNNTCEGSNHNKIELYSNGVLIWKNTPAAINPDCICCVEPLKSIQKLPFIRIGSLIKYDKRKYGSCQWIGLINGNETIGAKIQDNCSEATNGRFKNFMLFNCEPMKGFLFLADDVEHDVEKEKLYFVLDKIVDTNKIYSVSLDKQHEYADFIGSPAITVVTFHDGNKQELIGVIKWIGKINNEKCVGLDMEDKFDSGINGKIDDYHKFDCLEGHGMITLFDNIKLLKNIDKSHFCKNGIINPNKYLVCKEKLDKEFLNSRNVKLNEFVFVLLKDSNVERKKKGTLRWCGTMNELSVCIVELNEDHQLGTDGTFWRKQLIKCGKKRAIAVLSNNIYHYEPFESMSIPVDDRIFRDIDINSAVKYYHECDNGYKDLYGTVRWSGKDENGAYFYGIELDDRLNGGTDGQFNGQILFNCQYGHGTLAAIDLVGKDSRFVEADVAPENITSSEECQVKHSSFLTKLCEGLNKGIQGNANSCYFDSAIFALFVKSDVLDFMIDEINNEIETNETTKQFRRILAFKIIYPLRKFGLVSFHRTNEMRDVIVQYGSKFEEMTKQESDMENVAALLSKLCPGEQLLSIRSHNGNMTKCMFIQLFLTLGEKVEFMTSEEMLKISMVQNDIMFNELPTCLIMQAPRDARGINSYEFVLPLNIIEISQVCSNYFKQCFHCENEAVYQCKECIEGKLDISSSFICEHHKCVHNSKMKINISNKSTSKVYLELKAIICIEKCHFVSYVKQSEIKNQNIDNHWYFFDSMSSQSISNNYAIPKVTCSRNVADWLNSTIDDMKASIHSYAYEDIKRIVKDSYIFVYHNSAKTCY